MAREVKAIGVCHHRVISAANRGPLLGGWCSGLAHCARAPFLNVCKPQRTSTAAHIANILLLWSLETVDHWQGNYRHFKANSTPVSNDSGKRNVQKFLHTSACMLTSLQLKNQKSETLRVDLLFSQYWNQEKQPTQKL